MEAKRSHTGGILFIGDNAEALASIALASSVLNPNQTSVVCTSKMCTYAVCGAERFVKISFISLKRFVHQACINEECDSSLFASFIAQYNTIVFGMGDTLARMYSANVLIDAVQEVQAIGDWFNRHLATTLNATTHAPKATALFMYQSVLPTDMYCTHRKSNAQEHLQYQDVQQHDRRLWEMLSAGPIGAVKGLTTRRIDISEAMIAREELFMKEQTDQHARCEFLTRQSDTVQLLLNTIYHTLLEHVTPASFPKVTAPRTEDAYSKTIQRVALEEMSVLNYIAAQRSTEAARSAGWVLPQTTAVTLTLTDMRYAEHFPYWYQSRRLFGVEGIIVAMDASTCVHLEENFDGFLHLCMHTPETTKRAPPHKTSTLVAVGKIVFPLLFLAEYNMSVIFSEMDVFWRSSPYPFFAQESRKQYDIEVSAHVNFTPRKEVIAMPKEINIGFFYARPSLGGCQLFSDLLHMLVLMPFQHIDKVTADQKLFDRFIRNVPAPKGEDPPGMAELFLGWEEIRPPAHFEHFRWARLPGAIFTHNDVQELAIVPETVTYHISWGIDPPSRRIYCAYTLGLLPSNYTPTADFEKMTCFAYLYM